MQEQYVHSFNGQEIEESDINLVAKDAALADDRVLAELFRLAPDGSPVSKGILPYSGYTSQNYGTVVPGGGIGDQLRINPFRAFIASRTTSSVDPLNAWQDIRTSVFVGDAPHLYISIPNVSILLPANSSGNPRWDLVYCRVDIDASASTVTRYVKSPTTPFAITPTSISITKNTTATINTVQGTPSATPDLPLLPADTSSTFYIPLAYVRISNGFTSSSVISEVNIYEVAPVLNVSRVTGTTSAGIATTQNKAGIGGAISSSVIHGWGRPEVYLPPSMLGEEVIYIALDLQDASSANWSQQDGSIVDDSRDWRNRFFSWIVQGHTSSAARFSWKETSTGISSPTIPSTFGQDIGVNISFGFGQTFAADSSKFSTFPAFYVDNNNLSIIPPSGLPFILLYVDVSGNGALKMTTNGTVPGIRAFIRLCASSPFANV
jgi:hypothetical protein